jgi:hypothetical protein
MPRPVPDILPSATALDRGRSSAGRAPALQAGGRRFDPVRLHQAPSSQGRCDAGLAMPGDGSSKEEIGSGSAAYGGLVLECWTS